MAIKLIDRTKISHQEWLEVRKQGIGSSDAPVVLGLSPWCSPFNLYCQKLGIVEPPDETEKMEWGKILEDPIAQKYSERTGRDTVIEPYVLQHPQKSFLLANLDRVIPDSNDPGVLEIKTCSAFRKHEWEDEPPLLPQVQLQHQLLVTGYRWGSIAVLIGGQKLKWWDLERNDNFIAVLLEREEEFWERVKKYDPPMPDHMDATTEALLHLYPQDTGEIVELPPDIVEWDRELQEAEATKEVAEKTIKQIKNKIRLAMGTATYGKGPNGIYYQNKLQQRDAYTVPASKYRVLRRVKYIPFQ